MKLSEKLLNNAEWWIAEELRYPPPFINYPAYEHINLNHDVTAANDMWRRIAIATGGSINLCESWLCLLEAELQKDAEYTLALGGIRGDINDF